jgi:uncharacterized protein
MSSFRHALVLALLLAAGTAAAQESPKVPTGDEYVAMTAEQRYALRLQIRELPEAPRKAWLAQLQKVVHSLPEPMQHKLHDERNAMDAKYGTKPVQ